MSGAAFVIRSTRVVTPDGVAPGTIHVHGEIIERLGEYDDVGTATLEDCGDLAMLPGIVDSHVHVNEPGRTEWEGFETATRAAAAGGVTTIVDMPLNSVPATVNAGAVREKLDRVRGPVRVLLWGGIVPGNTADLEPMLAAGVRGFKCFMTPSGVPEFPNVAPSELEDALRALGGSPHPVLIHAEDPEVLEEAATRVLAERSVDRASYHAYLSSRPGNAELSAIRQAIDAAARTGTRIHIVHLSDARGVQIIREARDRGVKITVETCPHYLWFAAEDIPHGGTAWKCAPPIRDVTNRAALRRALADGEIDMVASDHSPCPPEMKALDIGDFFDAWGGIASLQLTLPVMWTIAADEGWTLEDIARWMSANTAALAGAGERLGAVAPGRLADLVAFDTDATSVVRGADLEHRHKVTPYEGARLRGRVVRTWVGGKLVHDSAAVSA